MSPHPLVWCGAPASTRFVCAVRSSNHACPIATGHPATPTHALRGQYPRDRALCLDTAFRFEARDVRKDGAQTIAGTRTHTSVSQLIASFETERPPRVVHPDPLLPSGGARPLRAGGGGRDKGFAPASSYAVETGRPRGVEAGLCRGGTCTTTYYTSQSHTRTCFISYKQAIAKATSPAHPLAVGNFTSLSPAQRVQMPCAPHLRPAARVRAGRAPHPPHTPARHRWCHRIFAVICGFFAVLVVTSVFIAFTVFRGGFF